MSTEEKDIENNEMTEKVKEELIKKNIQDKVENDQKILKEAHQQTQEIIQSYIKNLTDLDKKQKQLANAEDIYQENILLKKKESEAVLNTINNLGLDIASIDNEIVKYYNIINNPKQNNVSQESLDLTKKQLLLKTNNFIGLRWNGWISLFDNQEILQTNIYSEKYSINTIDLEKNFENIYFCDILSYDNPELVIKKDLLENKNPLRRLIPINKWYKNLSQKTVTIPDYKFQDVLLTISLLGECYDILMTEKEDSAMFEGPFILSDDSIYYLSYAFSKTESFVSLESPYDQYVMLNMMILFHIYVRTYLFAKIPQEKLSNKEFLEKVEEHFIENKIINDDDKENIGIIHQILSFTPFFATTFNQSNMQLYLTIQRYYAMLKFFAYILENSDMYEIENYDCFLYYWWISMFVIITNLFQTTNEREFLLKEKIISSYSLGDKEKVITPSSIPVLFDESQYFSFKGQNNLLFQFAHISAPFIKYNMETKKNDGEFYSICKRIWETKNEDKNSIEYLESIGNEPISDSAGMFLISLCFIKYTPTYLLPMYIENLIATRCHSEVVKKNVRYRNFNYIKKAFLKDTTDIMKEYIVTLKKVLKCYWDMRQSYIENITDDIIPDYTVLNIKPENFILPNKNILLRWHSINYLIETNELQLTDNEILNFNKGLEQALNNSNISSYAIDAKKYIKYVGPYLGGTLKYSMKRLDWLLFLSKFTTGLRFIQLVKDERYQYKMGSIVPVAYNNYFLERYREAFIFEDDYVLTGKASINPFYDNKMKCIILYKRKDQANYADLFNYYVTENKMPDLANYEETRYKLDIGEIDLVMNKQKIKFKNHADALNSIIDYALQSCDTTSRTFFSYYSPIISISKINFECTKQKEAVWKEIAGVENKTGISLKAVGELAQFVSNLLNVYISKGFPLENMFINYIHYNIYLPLNKKEFIHPGVISIGIFLISLAIRNVDFNKIGIEEIIDYIQEIIDLGQIESIDDNVIDNLYNKKKFYDYFSKYSLDYDRIKEFIKYSTDFISSVKRWKEIKTPINTIDNNQPIRIVDDNSSFNLVYREIGKLKTNIATLLSDQNTRIANMYTQMKTFNNIYSTAKSNEKNFIVDIIRDKIFAQQQLNSTLIILKQRENELAAAKKAYETCQDNLVSLQEKIKQNEKDSTVLQNGIVKFTKAKTEMNTIQNTYDKAKTDLINALTQVSTKNESLNTSVESIKKLLDSDNDGKIDLMDGIDKVSTTIGTLEESVNSSKRKIARVENQLKNKDSKLNIALDALTEQCNAIIQKKTSIETEISKATQIKEQIDNVEKELGEMINQGVISKDQLKLIQDTKSKYENQRKSYETKLEEVTKQVEEMTKLKEHFEKISKVELGTKKEKIDSQIKDYKNENKELTTKINNLNESIRKILEITISTEIAREAIYNQIQAGQAFINQFKQEMTEGFKLRLFQGDLKNFTINQIIKGSENKICQQLAIKLKTNFDKTFEGIEEIKSIYDQKLDDIFNEINLGNKVEKMVEKHFQLQNEKNKLALENLRNEYVSTLTNVKGNGEQFSQIYNNLILKINSRLSTTITNLIEICDFLFNKCYQQFSTESMFYNSVGKAVESKIIDACQSLESVGMLSDNMGVKFGEKGKHLTEAIKSIDVIKNWITKLKLARKEGNKLIEISNIDKITSPLQVIRMKRENENLKQKIIELEDELKEIKNKK